VITAEPRRHPRHYRGIVFAIVMFMPALLTAAPATRLLVTTDSCFSGVCPATRPPPITVIGAGSFFPLFVLALDDSGNFDTSYTGTVEISSSDALVGAPPSYTFTTADAGVKTFEIAFTHPGIESVTVVDAAGLLRPGGVTLTVTPIGLCTQTDAILCLAGGRFAVEAEWRRSSDPMGSAGHAVSMTGDTGYFWFFNPANVEVVAKVLNGCELGGHYWVFAGGLTNVEVLLTVTDTQTGAMNVYLNPVGMPFQPVQDTSTFATCP
jgi:hypothetical protein